MWICDNCGGTRFSKYVGEIVFDKNGIIEEEEDEEVTCNECGESGASITEIAIWE